jgi:ankyrin repeat protein
METNIAASVRDIPAISIAADNGINKLVLIPCVCSSRGREELLSIVTSHPESIREVDEKGYTALHWAAYFDDVEAAKCLLEVRSDIMSVRSTKGYVPLHLAAQQNSLRVLGLLLSIGAEVNTTNNWNETALHLAAQNGNMNAVRALLDHALIDCTVADKWNRTAFDVAVENGYGAVAMQIDPTRNEADIEAVRKNQIAASAMGSNDKAKQTNTAVTTDFLAALKARKKPQGNEISATAASGDIIVRNMFSVQKDTVFGTTTETTNSSPCGTVDARTSKLSPQVAEQVAPVATTKKKIPVSKKIEFPGNMEELEAMLKDQETYDIGGKDMYGLTALHKFASWDKEEFIDKILSFTSNNDAPAVTSDDVNCQCPQGFTPLHYCIEFTALRSLQRLFKDPRADISVRDKKGLTCLDMATKSPNAGNLVPLFDQLTSSV